GDNARRSAGARPKEIEMIPTDGKEQMASRLFYHTGTAVAAIFAVLFVIGIVAGKSFMESAPAMIAFGVIFTFLGVHLLIFPRRHADDAVARAERIAKMRWLGWMVTGWMLSNRWQYFHAWVCGVGFSLVGIGILVAGIIRL